nr:MAG TPA: hypothetical protein [Bacteriophage sp.]
MKGYRMTYEVEDERTKTEVEETIVFPAAAGPCSGVWGSLDVYDHKLYEMIDESSVISVENTVIGESLELDVTDGYHHIVNGEEFTLSWVDEPGAEKETWVDERGKKHIVEEYSVTDEDGNLLDCVLNTWMTLEEATAEIAQSMTRPRQTPSGDIIIKKVRKASDITTIRGVGSYSLSVTITELAHALGLKRGDLVKVTLEKIE